jgi:PAS domain S-box-containing protein
VLSVKQKRILKNMKKDNKTEAAAILREKAEELLKMKLSKTESQLSETEIQNRLKAGAQISETDILRLVHELEVHRIELRLENEELRLAMEQAETSSKKYTELYDFAPSGYFSLSQEGEIIELNLSGAKMLGQERLHLRNSRFGFFLSEDTRQVFNDFLQKVFENNTKESGEVALSTYRNSPMHIHITGIVTENGEHCLVTAIDITERKQAEEELIIAKEKAEESDRLKTAFLNNISHEIRTPFNGLLGFLSLIQGGNLTDSKRDRYISDIKRSAVRLINTINDIVEISKIQAGQMKLTFAETSINSLVAELSDRFKSEAESKGLSFILKNALPGTDYIINTDYNKLNLVLTGLINNAIKFTKEGSIEFGISKNADCMEFSVKDTGIGIPENKQQAILERFMQADVSDTRRFEGSGLGLSISKSYVEMLGGKIWLESEEGKGSTFYFTIPERK